MKELVFCINVFQKGFCDYTVSGLPNGALTHLNDYENGNFTYGDAMSKPDCGHRKIHTNTSYLPVW